VSKSLLAVGAVVVLVVVVFQWRSQPSFSESVETSGEVHATVVDMVSASFGAPSDSSRSMQGRFCGGLGGPTDKKALNLVTEWTLEGFEEERVTALIDEVQEFLSESTDVTESGISVGVVGDLILEARGRLFSLSVAGPLSPSATRFVVSVSTLSICGDPSTLETVE